jgi:hypothetical protein
VNCCNSLGATRDMYRSKEMAENVAGSTHSQCKIRFFVICQQTHRTCLRTFIELPVYSTIYFVVTYTLKSKKELIIEYIVRLMSRLASRAFDK